MILGRKVWNKISAVEGIKPVEGNLTREQILEKYKKKENNNELAVPVSSGTLVPVSAADSSEHSLRSNTVAPDGGAEQEALSSKV
jgi:predicted RNA-binding protein with PUA domain